MYIASLNGLRYEIYAIGQTMEECQSNLVEGFKQYIQSYHLTFEEWLAGNNIDYVDYKEDMWTFLNEYYGAHIFNIAKGYALGWE